MELGQASTICSAHLSESSRPSITISQMGHISRIIYSRINVRITFRSFDGFLEIQGLENFGEHWMKMGTEVAVLPISSVWRRFVNSIL
jgi:hypothetical protein